MKVKHLKKPTKQELIDDLQILCDNKLSLDINFDLIDRALNTTGSPLFEAAYMTFDHACDLISKKHNISPDDLYWFIYDNEMGEAGLECEITIDGNTKIIEVESVEDFVDTLQF